ncbi:MAG: sigma-54-dependent Fis family transcriptional regulator [Gammaproteobacteria bacterium]|nr:MAG: sigma-54-dependent Fis family transcriptional regulator [Gammaproteobacteria bacterium]
MNTAVEEPLNVAPRILIVEDEVDVARTLARVIEACGDYTVEVQCDPRQALDWLAAQPPDLIFTDLMMPGMDGFEVIRRVRALDADLPIVVVSAYATLENAVEAVRAGAFDFLAKPFTPESVELILAKLSRDLELRQRAARACRQAQQVDADLRALQGDSPAMVRLRQWICRVRDTQAAVLIEGESGTGKELVARALHAGRGPFVALNMAALPDELAEAELFGARKGAFTGADSHRDGLLLEANGGVLFLDEVNATSPSLQAKLLRVLQERKVRPLGGGGEQAVDFRLISAANQSLEDLIEQGLFRRDLYHRLKVLRILIPPLRDRRGDIPLLASHFLNRYARAHGRRVRRIEPAALNALQQADWPGNVRELENVIEQAVILCPESATELPLTLLPPELGGDGWFEGMGAQGEGVARSLAEVEWQYIRQVLQETGGNKAAAARILQIDYKTLLRKISRRGDE